MTDPSPSEPDFDPRFDPAFQPGYDPEVHAQRPHATRSAPARRPEPAVIEGARDRSGPSASSGLPAPVIAGPEAARPEASRPLAARTEARAPDAVASVVAVTGGSASAPSQPTIITTGFADALADPERSMAGRFRADPILIVMWIVSAALVAAGVGVVMFISDRLSRLELAGGGSGFDYYLLQVYTIAAPMLVMLGIATAIGTLFVIAARSAQSAQSAQSARNAAAAPPEVPRR